MSKIDKDKLEYAIDYISQLAEGANADAIDAILNDPNTIRIMYFVRDLLIKIRNEELREYHSNANKLDYPLESLAGFTFVREMTMNQFVELCNSYVDLDKYKGLSKTAIFQWLEKNGYLVKNENNKNRPSPKGAEIGIFVKQIRLANGLLVNANLYNRSAQIFLIKNMQLIMSRNNEESVPYPDV